jgi:hypothetical protein
MCDSSSQQQSYPTATGTQFDRFLGGTAGPAGEGTNPCAAQTGTGTGSSPYTFIMNGDFYWMLNSGSGYWRNPATSKLEVLPVDRPGTRTHRLEAVLAYLLERAGDAGAARESYLQATRMTASAPGQRDDAWLGQHGSEAEPVSKSLARSVPMR